MIVTERCIHISYKKNVNTFQISKSYGPFEGLVVPKNIYKYIDFYRWGHVIPYFAGLGEYNKNHSSPIVIKSISSQKTMLKIKTDAVKHRYIRH